MSQLRQLWIACVLVAACERGDNTAPTGSSTAASPPVGGAWVATASDGKEALRFELAGDAVTVSCAGKTLRGENKGDKRRYHSDGAFVAEVKAKDEGFKLRRDDGSLLWKVKLKDEKIKIGPEEEGEAPFAIKDKGGGEHEVEKNGARVGKVVHEAGKARVKGGDGDKRFEASAPRSSAAWGVLLLDDIAEEHRCVIAAELAARGR